MPRKPKLKTIGISELLYNSVMSYISIHRKGAYAYEVVDKAVERYLLEMELGDRSMLLNRGIDEIAGN